MSSRRKKRRGKDQWSPTPAQTAVAAVLRGNSSVDQHDPDDLESSDDTDLIHESAEIEIEDYDAGEEAAAAETDRREAPTAEHAVPPREPGPEPAAVQIAALFEELQEKDELVAALTEQLEEAANRLDRLHRAGADRISRGSSTDADRFDDHADVSEQISRLSAAWEDLNAADLLHEITRKLDDVYDALSQPAEDAPPQRQHAPAPVPTPAPRSPEPQNGRVAWEDMKAQLLRDDAEHDRPAEEPSRIGAGVNDSSADILAQIPLDPPASVDQETADRETLVAAVEERDVFISHLIRRLRSGLAGRYEPINWSAIASAPDDLRDRLQELEARLQELLRIEECDMSIGSPTPSDQASSAPASPASGPGWSSSAGTLSATRGTRTGAIPNSTTTRPPATASAAG